MLNEMWEKYVVLWRNLREEQIRLSWEGIVRKK